MTEFALDIVLTGFIVFLLVRTSKQIKRENKLREDLELVIKNPQLARRKLKK